MSDRFKKWHTGVCFAALVLALVLPAGCSPKSQIQETPNNIPKPLAQPYALKEWTESRFRRPASDQVAFDQQLAQQFPNTYFYQGPTTKKQVALTFDDGPDDHYTPQILAILKAKKAPATFFVVGEKAAQFPNQLHAIVAAGNAVGNHTWDHPRIPTLSLDGVTEELQKTNLQIQRVIGVRTDLFRPPYGFLHERDVPLIQSLGYRIVNGSLDTADYRGVGADQILKNVRTTLHPGSIIEMTSMASKPGQLEGTLKALPQVIDYVRAQGYQLVTVPTLLAR